VLQGSRQIGGQLNKPPRLIQPEVAFSNNIKDFSPLWHKYFKHTLGCYMRPAISVLVVYLTKLL
jgi:hypothetical protein